MQKQINDTRKDDQSIADYYGITVKELYEMADDESIKESKKNQEALAKSIVLLADANKGFNNRINGAVDDLVRGIEKIRNDVIWPKETETLHSAVHELEKLGVGPKSTLSVTEDFFYERIADGVNFLNDYGSYEAEQNDHLFNDALKNTKLDQLKYPDNYKPTNFIEVGEVLHGSHVDLENKFRNAFQQTDAHYQWVWWMRDQAKNG